MAKTSMVNREDKRAKLVKRYAAKRARLKEIIRKPTSSAAEREAAVNGFAGLIIQAAVHGCRTEPRQHG